jgi:hypothetical protein
METQKMTKKEIVLLLTVVILFLIYFWVDGKYLTLITN